MSLASQIKTLVQDAITTIGDLSETVIYNQVSIGAYDPATDAHTITTTTTTGVKCALVKLTEDDMDWFPANAVGQKALIPYLNLPITPTDDDHVTINGERWDVHKIKSVPGRSLHILYLRRT